MDHLEREYADAKAAYDVALQRLVAAKKALPPPISATRRERARIEEATWQSYLAGERDFAVLGANVGRSRSWATVFIRETLHQRRFGPETLLDYEFRQECERIVARFAAPPTASPAPAMVQ